MAAHFSILQWPYDPDPPLHIRYILHSILEIHTSGQSIPLALLHHLHLPSIICNKLIIVITNLLFFTFLLIHPPHDSSPISRLISKPCRRFPNSFVSSISNRANSQPSYIAKSLLLLRLWLVWLVCGGHHRYQVAGLLYSLMLLLAW